MGYRVEYGNQNGHTRDASIRIGRTVMITVAVMVVLFQFTVRFWPEGAVVLDKLTSFRGLNQMQQYLDILVQDLHSGMDIRQAVTAFCRDVIQLGIAYAA